LSAPLYETGSAVLEHLEKTSRAEKRLKTLTEEAAREKAAALLRKATAPHKDGSPPVVVEAYAEAGIDEALYIGKLAQKETRAALILASRRDLKFAAFCGDKDFDLRLLVKKAFEAQGGRGGGGPSFFQGSFATSQALDAFLQALEQ